ncbi:MAG TPA: SUMF1/EgtB/PvdO family nonheme iron enzyme [Anaerolineae bacterium]|nr:SUMF1/EgtB/PvdO family nonheme iron enzyme [Anaerolineae bacterium]
MERVVRGGSWNNNRRNCRAACRNRNDPANFDNNVGFRVALSHALAHGQ